MKRLPARWGKLGLAALVLALSGCMDRQAALQAWLEENRRSAPVELDPLAPVRSPESFQYSVTTGLDPFAAQRLERAAPIDPLAASQLAPDPKREREPLEAYPIDLLRMVGHLGDSRRMVALLAVENTVHMVRKGSRVGLNSGVVHQINEREVRLREVVQDPTGVWVRRETVISLQEGRR